MEQVTPLPAETVLLLEQVDNMPITAMMIKNWTHRNLLLSRVLVLSGWPKTITPDDQLNPYKKTRLKLSVQNGCLLWGNSVVIPSTKRVTSTSCWNDKDEAAG